MVNNRFNGATALETIEKAINIVKEGGSIRKAASETGLSRKKVREAVYSGPNPNEPDLENVDVRPNKKRIRDLVTIRESNPTIKKITKEAISLGVEKASDHIKERVVGLTDLLYTTAEEALKKTKVIVEEAAGLDPLDDWKVQQLKLLTSVWGTAIQSGQLLNAGEKKAEGNNVTNYNTIDARQIILNRIDKVTASEAQAAGE